MQDKNKASVEVGGKIRMSGECFGHREKGSVHTGRVTKIEKRQVKHNEDQQEVITEVEVCNARLDKPAEEGANHTDVVGLLPEEIELIA